MLSYEELMKKNGNKKKEQAIVGPSKDDVLYQKYMASKPKVAGGTVNPIISTNPKVGANRNLEGRKSQTYAQTLAANRAKASTLGENVPERIKPSGNIRELIFGTAKRGGTINPAISAADFSTRYDQMTDRENAIFSYYKKAGREKEAKEYLKSIEMDINQRAAAKRTADAKKLAEDSTVGGLYARYMAGLTSPLGAVYGAVQDGRGKAIDPNSPLFMGEQIRQGQTQGFLGDSADAEFGDKKWGEKILKEAGLGAFDWGTQMATLGALGLGGKALGTGSSALYGASAFGGNVKDATERGATGSEAVTYGAIGAAAEIITEKMGFDRLFELGKLAKIKGGKAGLAKELLKNIGSEGFEEGTTEAANLIADTLILGDRSQMAEVYNTAKEQGMTEGQAAKEALLTAAKQIGYSTAVGAASGGMIASGVAGLSRGLGRNALDYTDAQKEEMAQRQAEKAAKKAQTIAPVEEVEKTVENRAAASAEAAQESTQAAPQKVKWTEESFEKELRGYGEKYYGEKGQVAYIKIAKEKGTLDHTAAFNTYYRAGIAGIMENEIRQTAYTAAAEKMMLNAAYMAGAEDRKTEIANAIKGKSKISSKGGLILGEDVKATDGQLAITKLYADIGGAQIRLVNKIDQTVEGYKVNGYQEGDTITIALNADSFLGTVHHEMIHYIRKANPTGYDSMRELVFNLANKSGIDMEKTMEKYREDYGGAYGEDTQMADIMEEVVADAFQKIIENENDLPKFLNELRKKDRTVVEKIKEFLEKMEETIKALFQDNTYTEFAEELSKDLENIKALRKKFAEVLADTGKMDRVEKKNLNINEGTSNYKDVTKFSLKKAIEETKDLIAVHNLKAEDLDRALQIGGFPMPSIAIVKDTMGHNKYGEISIIFGKDSIDPERDKRNVVYGGDAWTPTVPQVDYQIQYEKKRAIEKELDDLAGKVAGGIFGNGSILSSMGVDESTTLSKQELAEKMAENDTVRAAYLAERGMDIAPIYKEKVYDRNGNDFLQKIIDKYGEQKLSSFIVKLETGEELDEEIIKEVRELWKENWISTLSNHLRQKRTPEQIAKKAEEHGQKQVRDSYDAGELLRHTWKMYEEGGGTTEEIDRLGTADRLREVVSHKQAADWIEKKMDGLFGEAGIYNGREYYTASGNRRSFDQLHYPYTLENLVKAMKEVQKERGEGLWGLTASGLQSVAVAEYGSIEEIRADRGRLRMEGEEDYKKSLEDLDEKIGAVIQRVKDTTEAHSSNPFIESDIIGEVILGVIGKKGKLTPQKVKKHFASEDYQITDQLAEEILSIYTDAASIPTGYFEAKPQRAVGLDEIQAVIIPENLDGNMRKRLEERDIPVVEYAEGNEKSRLEAVNSVPNVKFSIRKEEIEADIAENEHWKAAYEGILREFEVTKEPLKDRESAKKVVRRFLKKIESKYDEEEFLNRFVRLCNFGADMQSDSDYKDLLTACTMLAEDALRESAHINRELYDTYADLRKQLRENTLHIGKDTLEELEAMGIKYNELRTKNFGRVRISQKSGEKIDTKYAELAEVYPELFKVDQSTSKGELLMDMIMVRESMEPIIENPYFDNMEEYAATSAYELLGMMNDIALEKQTFADKYEEKLRELREKNKQALQNARERAKNEKKLMQEKYATNAEARIAEVKQRYEKRIDRKEYWRLRKLAVKDAKALAEWLKAPTDKNHVPKKFKESVETVLALIETDKPDLRIPLKSFVAMRGGLMELYGDTQGIYLYVEQDDQVINILDRFIQKYPDGANLDTMDGTDMKYFRNLIASVKKACMDANKLHTSQREKSAVAVSEGFIRASQKKKDARETGMIRRVQDFLGLEMLDANSFFKRIGGDVYNELWKGLRKGMDKKIGRWKDTMDFINGLIDPKEVRKWTEAPAKEFEIGGTKVYLTIPQIMSLACLMRRSQARQHIIGTDIPTENGILRIRGGGFKAEPLGKDKKAKLEKAKVVEPTEADIKKMIGTLTEEQTRVAYEMQQYLSNEVAAWGNETSMMMFGYEKFTTENYFPIISDKNFVNQLVTKTDDIAPSLRSMGMTKNINQYANNPVIIQDIFRVFANHVDQMSNYNAFVASESDFNKFMNYKVKAEDGRIYSVKDEMDRTMGAGGAKYIKTLMNRLVTAAGLSDDSDFAKMFVRNMKVASVGANLRVIVQQPTAYLRAANQMSLKYLLNPAVFQKTDKDTIYKYAPIALWKSWGNYEMDTGKTMYEQIIAPTKFAWTKDKLMAGAGLADELTWSRLWNACVLETKDKHKGISEEEIYRIAGERFEEIVDESQVVDSILHRSQIMRKKGLYTQMATSFMSEPIKNFNMASNALVELIQNNTPENRKKFVRCYMTIIASGIATACAAGLVDAMRDDDDDDEFFKKWKKAVLGDYSEAETPSDFVMAVLSNNIADNLNPMGMIPYLRDAWSMIQGYDIKRTDFDWLNDIIKSMKRWKDFIAGESEYTLYSMLLNTAGAISKMAGIPIGSASRDLKAFSNLIVVHIVGEDEKKYDYRKLSKDIGSEKNTSYYVGRMLQAKFSGNDALATRIYNDMVKAGISNEKIDTKIETQEKKALKEEAETMQAAEAYARGDADAYLKAYDSLLQKGYTGGNISKAIKSVYNKMKTGEEEEETFEPITRDYWDEDEEPDFADYEMMFNAYMDGSQSDYDRMWDILEAAGKEKSNIKQSMKDRLKKAYQAAKAEGDYQKAQKAKNEFLRLGGKPETLEN